MNKKILVVKHPSGIKRTIEFNKSTSLGDVLTAASKQFNLNQHAHELKLGTMTLNLNATIEGSRIPETVALEIAPKTGLGNKKARMEVLVRMGFSDEGYLYENCSEVMNSNRSLWGVVKRMVPRHMAYSDEDVCLTYLGIKYVGKKRLKTVKLGDLCGRERQLFFTCSRNYLQKPYKRAAVKNDKQSKAPMKYQRTYRESEKLDEDQIDAEPTLGNPNPGVVELSERLGRLYHGRFIGASMSANGKGELGNERSFDSTRKDTEESKMTVRIVFPKTAVMEGVFSNEETIKDVANFVKNHLVEKAKQFYFYTVHPRLTVGPDVKLGNMRSSPPGILWYCGKFKSELFRKDIHSSLVGKTFSYVSTDIPEESKFDLSVTPSMYSWELNAPQPR